MRGADNCTRSSTSSIVIGRRVCALAIDRLPAIRNAAKAARLDRTRARRRKVIRYYYLMDNDFETVILSACRTPIGAFGGVFKDVSAVDLGAVVIREAIARAGVQMSDIGDVVMGCVLQSGAGMNVARQA